MLHLKLPEEIGKNLQMKPQKESKKTEAEKEKDTDDPIHPQDPAQEEVKESVELPTEGTIVEVKAVSLKGVKNTSSSSSTERRRTLTEKEEDDRDEDLEVLEEDELLNAKYVDEIEEDGSSEDDALRAAVQIPFEEESLEAEFAEEATHPFRDFEEELLQICEKH